VEALAGVGATGK